MGGKQIDNYELYRNLFSNQIFKPTDESYNKKDGLLNEKQIKFQSDRNGFLFSDGKIELEKNYLSDFCVSNLFFYLIKNSML